MRAAELAAFEVHDIDSECMRLWIERGNGGRYPQRHAPAGAAGICKRDEPRTLRQRFAAHLLGDGIDVPIIQAQLGHAKLETTACGAWVAYDLWLAERGCRSAVDRGSPAGTRRRFSIDQVK